jgi:Bacterial PH domain
VPADSSWPLRQEIPLESITHVEEAWNPLLDERFNSSKVVIQYGNGRRALIAPRDRAAFVAALRARVWHRDDRGAQLAL